MKKTFLILSIFILLHGVCNAQVNKFIFTDTIQSQYLDKSQVVNIYLPPDYYNSKDEYPLQVVLGGYWRTKLYYSINDYLSTTYQILDLNHLHTIPESIIVGLSTAPRNNFNNFKKFIETELIPHIESKYRKTNYKSLIGHSSDGEFVLHNLFDDKSLFNSYFCTAPTNSNYFINKLKDNKTLFKFNEHPKRLFFGASQQDYFYDENLKLIEVFNNVENENFLFQSSIKTTDTHHTIFPALILEALSFTYRDWYFYIPKSQPSQITELFIKHYKQLSHSIGLKIKPPEFEFYLLTYVLDARKHIDEKIELLNKCKEFYPKAENADAYLARTYYMIDDIENAKIFNNKALKLNAENKFALETRQLINEKKKIEELTPNRIKK